MLADTFKAGCMPKEYTGGCSVDLKDIAMLGKWSNEHIVKSYVNGIPISAVLARAGFQNHVYLIPRTTVEADQELLDMIFPGVEQRHSEQVEVRYAMICPPMHNLCSSSRHPADNSYRFQSKVFRQTKQD
jgi:hypothetical protein